MRYEDMQMRYEGMGQDWTQILEAVTPVVSSAINAFSPTQKVTTASQQPQIVVLPSQGQKSPVPTWVWVALPVTVIAGALILTRPRRR